MVRQQQFQEYQSKFKALKRQLFCRKLKIGHLKTNATHHRRKIYDPVEFLWLDMLLVAMGYVSIRTKACFLQDQIDHQQCKVLERLWNVVLPKKVPSIGYFSDYTKYFDARELEALQNQALKSIAFLRRDYNLISIDAKDVRRCKEKNAITVNVVINHALQASYVTHNEKAWIKRHLLATLAKLYEKSHHHGVDVFIGDSAYFNTTIKQWFEKRGYKALLPLKNTTDRLDSAIDNAINMSLRQGRSVQYDDYDKQSCKLIHDRVRLIAINYKRYPELQHWKYVLDITTTWTHPITGEITEKRRRYLTNLDVQLTQEATKRLRDLVRQHWQVETFHKYKDLHFVEDRFAKSSSKAVILALKNNLTRALQTSFGVNGKYTIQRFNITILSLLAFLWIFLAEHY